MDMLWKCFRVPAYPLSGVERAPHDVDMCVCRRASVTCLRLDMSHHVDCMSMPCGSFFVMPKRSLKQGFPTCGYGTIGFMSGDASVKKATLDEAKSFATSFKD